ncbi:putative quinol monooxygenase [Alkalicoccobacillus porphyridii]|uniref:Antibiotic biosynthesis monooxygenase n=1 Tax=Alkalicoccobacillus porphyridii TaxID=2597270 RepID=A0A554A2M4_9BACI|nr:putative quinol monooxygenase [Alkalicoccobacillus porphyridii]TSB47937.1 antibiotic biosynthesis monooxygenase [Alkalicoccobacillus porphyridii]
MIIIHAKMSVKPEYKEEFLKEIEAVIEGTRAEAGNTSYELFQDPKDANGFVMVENWKDMEAVQAHNTSPHFQSFIAAAKDMLSAPLQADVYQGEKLN